MHALCGLQPEKGYFWMEANYAFWPGAISQVEGGDPMGVIDKHGDLSYQGQKFIL
jgi:hypothetical protein